MATDLIDVGSETDALPDRYEIVNGVVIEVPPMSFYAQEVAALLHDAIRMYLLTADTGRARMEQAFLIPLSQDDTHTRRPDAVYISYDRWLRQRRLPRRGIALPAVPELVVEVVSPTDKAGEVADKTLDYLNGGVRLVWVIYPDARIVHAFDGTSTARIFRETDMLTAGDVLPGFSVRLSDLFPEPEDDEPGTEDE